MRKASQDDCHCEEGKVLEQWNAPPPPPSHFLPPSLPNSTKVVHISIRRGRGWDGEGGRGSAGEAVINNHSARGASLGKCPQRLVRWLRASTTTTASTTITTTTTITTFAYTTTTRAFTTVPTSTATLSKFIMLLFFLSLSLLFLFPHSLLHSVPGLPLSSAGDYDKSQLNPQR